MKTQAVPGSGLGPEYDRFLFAPIGVDRNGMQVSVLSGLARSDLDPWQEAARLAGLPGKSAVERLAALIEALPGKAWAQPEARAVATRLIALLPRTLADHAASSEISDRVGTMIRAQPWWVYGILVFLVLGSQLLIAIHPPPPATHRDAVDVAGEVTPPPMAIGQ
jgi:hypothetical protein